MVRRFDCGGVRWGGRSAVFACRQIRVRRRQMQGDRELSGRNLTPISVAGRPASAYVPRMGRHDKLLAQLLGGRTDANIGFDAICALLRQLGFLERTRGSHHMFRRAGIEELVNLQRDGDKAKVYQVRQVRAVLLRYGLTTIEGDEE